MSNFTGADFADPDGLLCLSPKHKSNGAVWGRPSQFMTQPVVIREFTYHSLRQTLVGDCSFVSSLAVCASWEHRFQKTLISGNIFPQDTNKMPIVSPTGTCNCVTASAPAMPFPPV
jgi:calpain-7